MMETVLELLKTEKRTKEKIEELEEKIAECLKIHSRNVEAYLFEKGKMNEPKTKITLYISNELVINEIVIRKLQQLLGIINYEIIATDGCSPLEIIFYPQEEEENNDETET